MTINKLQYNLPFTALFDIAARENLKREFLFVSKVLGKHIPINPLSLKIIGGLLARTWQGEIEDINFEDISILVEALIKLQPITTQDFSSSETHNLSPYETQMVINTLNTKLKLSEKTLFIGFAETATGIAQSVFSNFENASYIHTTREKILTLEPNFVFKEEHSHAVDHSIFSLDKNFLNNFDRIVLIDDELTTGNTALNLMKNLPGHEFGLITILDWRDELQVAKFENNGDVNVTVSSLVKGTIEFLKEGPSVVSDPPLKILETTAVQHTDVAFSCANLIEGYLPYTGRFGMNSLDNNKLEAEIVQLGIDLKAKRINGNCLCLGTEEFIYVPCMLSAQLGDDVYFHSTTKSPIHPRNLETYCIKNKLEFPCPSDEHTMNYLYNIPKGLYSQVFLFSEKPLPENSKRLFDNIFSTLGITNIVYVFWK